MNISFVFAQTFGLRPPAHPSGTVSLFEKDLPGLSRYYADSTLFSMRFSRYQREITLDSSNQIINIRELLYGKDYRIPVAMDLEYYRQEKIESDNAEAWRQTVVKNVGIESARAGTGIELNIPVKIKSKAFKRIFGGDRVGLRVTGNISFEIAGRSESREGSAVSSYEQRGNFSPRFNQTQQFQVEGKVGDKVSVKVDQNSEATFDFENTLRLTYTGDEDEIIQSIEAGNVSLTLPSTNYVSASSKSQGLFGLKTALQMGNLSFVGIASLQRGEKQKLTKTGGAAENTVRIRDYEYTRDRFYFIDDYYADNFESSYDPQTMQWRVFNADSRIKQLDVWITARPGDTETRQGWAVLDPQDYEGVDFDTLQVINGVQEYGYFKKLDESGYFYDEYRGFFWLNTSVDEKDVIAVSYVTDGGLQKGMLFNEVTDSSAIVLTKLIRAQGFNEKYPTWKLGMRNVYNLGSSNISLEGFDINIVYTKTGEDVDVQPFPPTKSFIYLMGLDRLDEQGAFIDGGDKRIDIRNGNLFDLVNGYLIFPSTTPFAPPSGSNFAIDSSLYVKIYNTKDRTIELNEHKFHIEITTSSISSTFSLGFNVLEGSEIVRLNGRELVKDRDYTIDYFGGTLQILAEEARRADANVDIEYERGSLFQLDKKTLLGGRMEYSFGERGFIGATGLYLNKSTLDQRIRLGQEPVKNVIFDVNTALNFKPNWITKIMDFLPVVETSAESKFAIEAEYAQVNPNPNTFNEESLGEKSGVAYIDDFEGSKRMTPLGIIYRTWSKASTPVRFRIPNRGVDFSVNRINSEAMYRTDRNRLNMFWYNPYNQVPINDIWPNKDVNAQTGTTTNVLVLQWKNENVSPDSAWAGIMRSTVSFPNQQKTKFIELWVKGTIGQINVDIGKISEDFYIREGTETFDGKPSLGYLNTEDKNLNELLDFDEDVGLDGIPTGQPNADEFDVWAPPQNTSPPFERINGTEGNGQAQGAKYPDTEDLDGNGGLNLANDYFTYSFSLADSIHPYINGRTEKGWRLYRVPIRNYNPDLIVGDPDTSFQEVYYVRLWINDLPKDNTYRTIQIATFDFVGNEWEEIGIAADDFSQFVKNDSLFNITVYNTEENAEPPESYRPPPGVSGVRDRITQALSKEQSLVMQLNRLDPGARAEATKQLYEKMNLINYKKLKLFLHGNPFLPGEDSPLEFYIRFGPAQGIYYEIGSKIYPGWDTRNHLDVVLDELAKTKDKAFYQGDSAGPGYYYRRNPQNPEQYFKVVITSTTEPNLRNINFMVIGARNIGDQPLFFSEIWLDELRVTDVYRDKGTAMRLLTDLTIADVGNIRAQWEVVDADFRRIEDQFGTGSTTERQSYRMSLKMEKFLPSSWGFRIPVSGGFVRSRNIPKYYYNTDQLTNYRAEGFEDKVMQFFGLKELDPELEANSRISETTSLGATFKRQSSPTSPWYLKYSIDMFTFDADWSEKTNSDERNDRNDSENISGRVALRIPFAKDNFIQPFSWLGNGIIVRMLSREKIYYTPSSVDASVGISDNETIRKARLEDEPTTTIRTTSNRKVGLSYNLVPSISLNYKRDYQSDASLKGYRTADLIEAIVKKGDFGVDRVINQNFNVNYSPRWFSWMTQGLKYSSNFNYNYRNVQTNEKTISQQVNKQLNFSIKPSDLARKFYNPRKRKVQNQTRGRTPPKPPSKGIPGAKDESDEPGDSKDLERLKDNDPEIEKMEKDSSKSSEKKEPPERERKIISSINPLKLFWRFFDAWKTLGVNYQVTDNSSHFNVSDIPNMKYQFGFTDDPGVETDTSFGKIARPPAFKNAQSLSGNLGFDIIKNLSSSFKYNYTKDLSDNQQIKQENIASSFFFIGDDPEENKKPWYNIVPDWQLRLTGLEKLFFFSKYAKSIQVEHARSGKANETNRYDEEGKTKTSWGYANNYSPFLGLSISTVWGITCNLRYTKSATFSYSATGGDNKTLRSGFDLTLSLSKSSGITLPLPFLKNKRLKNEVQLNLTVSQSSDVSFARRTGFGSRKFIEQNKNDSFKFKPSATYRFSQKVNGSAFVEYSVSQNKRTGKYSYFEFGVNVNIQIR